MKNNSYLFVKFIILITVLSGISLAGYYVINSIPQKPESSPALEVKIDTIAGIVQEIKHQPRYTATTYVVDVALKAKQQGNLWFVLKDAIIFTGKLQICYNFEEFSEKNVVKVEGGYQVEFPGAKLCDENFAMDIIPIVAEGNAEEYIKAQTMLGKVARKYAILVAINRGIFEESEKDMNSLEKFLNIFGKEHYFIKLNATDLKSYKEKIEKEFINSLVDLGVEVQLISSPDQAEYFDYLQKKAEEIKKLKV